jgi:hypothetical protein
MVLDANSMVCSAHPSLADLNHDAAQVVAAIKPIYTAPAFRLVAIGASCILIAENHRRSPTQQVLR